jgi:cell division septum initiation protein DivIVA
MGEQFYRTVQQEEEFLERELEFLERDLEYLEHQKVGIDNDIKKTKDLINKVTLELGRK